MKNKKLKEKVQEMESNKDLSMLLNAWGNPDTKKRLDDAYTKKFESSNKEEVIIDGEGSKLDSEGSVSKEETSEE